MTSDGRFTQAEALVLYRELRLLEPRLARLELLPPDDSLKLFVPAIRDRVRLLTAGLRLYCDPVTLASLDDLVWSDPPAPTLNAAGPPGRIH
jgi:hypothetical protein